MQDIENLRAIDQCLQSGIHPNLLIFQPDAIAGTRQPKRMSQPDASSEATRTAVSVRCELDDVAAEPAHCERQEPGLICRKA